MWMGEIVVCKSGKNLELVKSSQGVETKGARGRRRDLSRKLCIAASTKSA